VGAGLAAKKLSESTEGGRIMAENRNTTPGSSGGITATENLSRDFLLTMLFCILRWA
jgi:hypothetical protein